MSNEIPKPPPIEEVIKRVLLSIREIPGWQVDMGADVILHFTGELPKTSPKEKPVFEGYWYFNQMTPKQIEELPPPELRSKLRGMETQQLDDFVKRLPPDLEDTFWEFVYPDDK